MLKSGRGFGEFAFWQTGAKNESVGLNGRVDGTERGLAWVKH